MLALNAPSSGHALVLSGSHFFVLPSGSGEGLKFSRRQPHLKQKVNTRGSFLTQDG